MAFWGAPWVSHKRRGLRVAVCIILGKGPKSGAEVIDEMERMSDGWWRPSPGSVYPLLEDMAQEGVVERKEDGRYVLKASAREQYGRFWNRWGPGSPRTVGDCVTELSSLVSYLEDLRESKAKEIEGAKSGLKSAWERLGKIVR
jgi:DNA-binding PadR family transcriptional regulator